MGREPQATPHGPPATQEGAVAVISAYGAFRVLIVLLAVWTFFEGFSLFTGGFDALTLGGHDRTAERIIGAQMIVQVPVYGLLAWDRARYRLLIWLPAGAQLAIIMPILWALVVHQETSGFLLLVVSIIFFALLFYFWWHSHPLEFFRPEDEPYEGDGEEEDADGDEGDAGDAQRPADARGARRRFRRRD